MNHIQHIELNKRGIWKVCFLLNFPFQKCLFWRRFGQSFLITHNWNGKEACTHKWMVENEETMPNFCNTKMAHKPYTAYRPKMCNLESAVFLFNSPFQNDNFWSVFGQSWLKTHNRNLKSVFAEFGHSLLVFNHPCVTTGFFPPSNFGYAPRLAKNCSQRAFLKRRLEPKFRKFLCHDKMAHKISFAIDLITSKWPKITPKTIYLPYHLGKNLVSWRFGGLDGRRLKGCRGASEYLARQNPSI